ncbi:lipocalin-like domain-containing protein [Fructobacillus tropaeoli]|uniref:lipocalin-like domain-containing protein n=1 Tax=Fructobacillus tropaeoli TaxID=709323 RepID=UPI002D8D4E5E|nr:Predicted lipocalin [Fructobacillus tropaeoli]
MADGRVMDTAADFEKFGVNPKKVENWEDGRRDNDEPGHGEIWYIDCSFDDKTTLVLGFRPKSTDQVNKKGFNPNIAMNYNTKAGEPFNDYRLYKAEDVYTSDESADLKWGENTLKGHDWQSYDVHIEPEDDYEVEFEGKKSVQHQTAMDLHFEAEVAPFRPGNGYITFGPNDEYYYNFICVTKLKVTGHLKINGEDKEVTGQAYYNHQWFNISPMEAFHSWVWGRQNSGKYSVLLYDMVGADRFGQPKIPLFTVDDENGKRVIENIDDQHAKVEVLDTYVQEKTGKTYPKELRYTFEDDGVTAEFTIKNPQEINLIDIYGMAPKAAQERFDQAGLQPTYTRYLAETTLKVTQNGQTDTVNDKMLYEINFAAKTF